MKICVIKNTTRVINASEMHSEDEFIREAQSAGFTAEQVEILTQEQYDNRKALEPKPIPQPSELETLANYLLNVDMRLLMVEMGLL